MTTDILSLIPSNEEVAARIGLELCDFCGEPRGVHYGFDHGKRRCLLDFNGWFIQMNGLLTKKQKSELVRKLNEYYETIERNEDARLSVGSGI